MVGSIKMSAHYVAQNILIHLSEGS